MILNNALILDNILIVSLKYQQLIYFFFDERLMFLRLINRRNNNVIVKISWIRLSFIFIRRHQFIDFLKILKCHIKFTALLFYESITVSSCTPIWAKIKDTLIWIIKCLSRMVLYQLLKFVINIKNNLFNFISEFNF